VIFEEGHPHRTSSSVGGTYLSSTSRSRLHSTMELIS
jgi:hypothetical protein